MKSAHSSTLDVPEVKNIPRHIAIVMDGNGRWAKSKFLPRVAGHKRGVDALRKTVQACVARGVECLTVFAFSSENWRRPADEVSLLMRLFIRVLKHELHSMHAEGIRLKIVGDVSAFEPELQEAIRYAENLTDSNTAFQLNVAANYGGRWDVLNAVRSMLTANPAFADKPHLVTESNLSPFLALSDCPEPDLFVRTGGEQRISNFLLWQMAYTEFYFTQCLWPDFGPEALDQAILSYQQRERRFGRTSEQLLPEAALGLCPNSSQPKSMGAFPHHS